MMMAPVYIYVYMAGSVLHCPSHFGDHGAGFGWVAPDWGGCDGWRLGGGGLWGSRGLDIAPVIPIKWMTPKIGLGRCWGGVMVGFKGKVKRKHRRLSQFYPDA